MDESAEFARLSSELRAARRRIQSLQDENGRLRKRTDSLEASRDLMIDQLRRLRASKSWRATAAIRASLRRLRGQ